MYTKLFISVIRTGMYVHTYTCMNVYIILLWALDYLGNSYLTG